MKTRKWLCVITALVMLFGVSALVMGCSDEDKNKVEVRFYDGTTVIKTEKVEKGGKATSWTPTKDGKEFMGWYADTLFTQPFDFNTVINEKTSVYADWRTTPVAADDRIWYAIGGQNDDTFDDSTLEKSGWAFATEAAKDATSGEVTLDANGYATFAVKEGMEDVVMTKDTSVTDKNVYKLTLTLRAKNKFRFLTSAYNDNWTGDKGTKDVGLGAVTGFTYAAGENPEDPGSDVTAAEKLRGEVRDASGKLVFEGGKEYNADPKGWNFFVADGADGRYTFTLTTYPGEDRFDTIDWKLEEAIAVTTKMAVVDEADTVLGNLKLRDGKWTGSVVVTEAKNAYFKNILGDEKYGSDGETATNSNALALTAGAWIVSIDVQTKQVTCKEALFYLVGTFLNNEQVVDFSLLDGFSMRLTTTDGNVFKATVAITDVTGNNAYSWLKNENPPAIFALKPVLVTGDLPSTPSKDMIDWSATPQANQFIYEEGTYEISYTLSTNTVSVTKKVTA